MSLKRKPLSVWASLGSTLIMGLLLVACDGFNGHSATPVPSPVAGNPVSSSPVSSLTGLNGYYRLASGQQVYTQRQSTIDGTLQSAHPEAVEVGWYGYLTPAQAGEYTFTLSEGLQLSLDNVPVKSGQPFALQAGHHYGLKARVSQGRAVPSVTWHRSGGHPEPLPGTLLTTSLSAQALPTGITPPFDILSASFDLQNGSSYTASWATGLSDFQEGVTTTNGVSSSWQAADYAAALSTDTYRGNGALKLQAGQEYNLYTSVAEVLNASTYFQPGATYKVSAFVKGSSGAVCNVSLLEPSLNVGTVSGGGNYTEVNGLFTYQGIPTNLNVKMTNTGTGQCQFDEVKITWLSAPETLPEPAQNLLLNGDFEQGDTVPAWNFPYQNVDPKQFLTSPGSSGTAHALGFKESQGKILAVQQIKASQLLPNTRYILKAVGQAQNDTCLLALRSTVDRKVLATTSLPLKTDWNETGFSFMTPAQPEDLDVELHLGSNTSQATCLMDNVRFGPAVGTGSGSDPGSDPTNPNPSTEETPDDPIGELHPHVSVPAVFLGGEVGFEAGVTDGTSDNLSYEWYFGDGTNAIGDSETNGNIGHAYYKPGYYRATLKVTDLDSGKSKTSTTEVAVMPDVHDLPSTRASYGEDPVTFDVIAPVKGLNYEWKFDDKTIVSGSRIEQNFSELGFHDVTLTVYDDRAGVNIERPILYQVETRVNKIVPHPVSSMRITAGAGAMNFEALDNSDLGWNYTWDFGDGTTATGKNASHRFSYGRYAVSLTVEDRYGQKDVSHGIVFSQDSRAGNPAVVVPLTNENLSLGNLQSQGGVGVNSTHFAQNVAMFSDSGSQKLKGQEIDNNKKLYYPYLLPKNFAAWNTSAWAGDTDKLILMGSVSSSGAGQPSSTKYNNCYKDKFNRDVCSGVEFSKTPSLNTGINHSYVSLSGVDPEKSESISWNYDTNYVAIDSLRIPHIMLNIIPDTQLDDERVKIYTFNNEDRNEMFALVNVRESELHDNTVKFNLPAFAVDESGKIIDDATGVLYASTSKEGLRANIRDGILNHGRGELEVYLSLDKFDNGQTITVGDLDITSDPTGFPASGHRLSGVGSISTGYVTPSAAFDDRSYFVTYNFPDLDLTAQSLKAQGVSCKSVYDKYLKGVMDKVGFGKNSLQRRRIDSSLEWYEGSPVSILPSILPYVGDGIDLIAQGYYCVTGKGADPVVVTMASIGLGMDIFTVYGGEPVTVIKEFYKVGGKTAKIVVELSIKEIKTGKRTPKEAYEVLSGSLKFFESIPLREFMKKDTKDAIKDALDFASDSFDSPLTALKKYNDTYLKFDKIAPPQRTIIERIKIAKYGMFAPETARAMADCGGECIRTLEEFDQFAAKKGIKRSSGHEKFENNTNKTENRNAQQHYNESSEDVVQESNWRTRCEIGSNSFIASTLVRTLTGFQPISQLLVGDQVLAYNEATGQNGYYPITATYHHLDDSITTLVLQAGDQSETITTTPEHPFYVAEQQGSSVRPRPVGHEELNSHWVGAGHLVTGDKLKLADGSVGEVRNVTTQQKTQEMFNLTVDTAHTFYVGSNGWLVHNIGGKPNLSYTIQPSEEGLKIIREHLSGDLSANFNDAMIERIQSALKSGQQLTGADANFYLHEIKESKLMSGGMGYKEAHAASLKAYKHVEFDLYHPDVISRFPDEFNFKWFEYWGICKL